MVDDAGDAHDIDEGGAVALAGHWGRTFASGGPVSHDAMQRLRNGISFATFAPCLTAADDLRRLLDRCPRSAPGPDGIAYAHWKGAGDIAVKASHDVCLVGLSGEVVPPCFNSGTRIGCHCEDGCQPGRQEHRAAPRDLRPLTLGNTSHKLLMMLVNMMLEELARVVVRPSQRGFIRGRYLPTHVVELEVEVVGFLHDDETASAAVLLDIAAAFPSAESEYIRWVLLASLVKARLSSRGPTQVELYRNGRATDRRLRVRGSPGLPRERHCLGAPLRPNREQYAAGPTA